MIQRLALPLLVLLLAAGCSRNDTAAPADATPAAAPAAATAPAGQADATAPVAVDPAAAAAAAKAAADAANAPPPVAGTDYVEIAGGQPFDPLNGQVEVAEVFGYTCPHCATFQGLVNAWKQAKPADVRFTYVPAAFGGYWEPYAKAYYAAEAMGVADRAHDAVFRAVHIDRSLPVQPIPTNDQLGAFYAQFGVDAKQFASTMSSFAVNGKLNRARQFIERSFAGDVASTPTIIVNGKYRVTGKSFEDTLRITNQLIARERTAAAPAAPAAQ